MYSKLASIRISNGLPLLVYYDHYTKLHIVANSEYEIVIIIM